MGKQVVMGAVLQCPFGAAPSSLTVIRPMTSADKMPAANVGDSKPMVNILPFGMCSSLSNPTVASATSAALGVLTPMPCIPSIPAPWSPGAPTVTIEGMAALNDSSTCNCVYGGTIAIKAPGSSTVSIP